MLQFHVNAPVIYLILVSIRGQVDFLELRHHSKGHHMSTVRLSAPENEEDYRACFVLMRALRPHINDADEFIEQTRRQALQGYRLLAAWDGDQPSALAGYRFQENFLYGRFLYVDDLVASSEVRRQGLGTILITALRKEAWNNGCVHLVLDTALSNSLGQRFYYRQGLLATGIHFVQQI